MNSQQHWDHILGNQTLIKRDLKDPRTIWCGCGQTIFPTKPGTHFSVEIKDETKKIEMYQI